MLPAICRQELSGWWLAVHLAKIEKQSMEVRKERKNNGGEGRKEEVWRRDEKYKFKKSK